MSLSLILTMVGCSPENIEPANDGLTFNFTEVEIDQTRVEIIVNPSDAETNYYVGILESAEISATEDKAIIDDVVAGVHDWKVGKGPRNVVSEGLTPDTEYTVIAFEYGATDAVTRHTVRTLKSLGKLPHNDFEVGIEILDITDTSAVAKTKPNSSENRYLFRVVTKMELTAFGIYENNLEIFKYIIENPNSNDYIYTGSKSFNLSLAAETDYLAVAFNVESYEQVLSGEMEVKLFRQEFRTLKGEEVDPDTLFKTQNLVTTHSGFTLDVTPVKGEESFWTYYIWTKKDYEETLATEARVNIVMRSYWGLNNLSVDQGYTFGDFIQNYMGQIGSSQILNYEPLKNNTEYVVVLFYMDPEVKDPTVVYDYNYVAVEFKTKAPTEGSEATLEVVGPVIEPTDVKYTIKFNVKTNENAVDLKVGAQLYANYDFAKYWDENDWSQIQAFFLFRKSVGADTLAAAKSADGATVSFTDFDKDGYVFFFEVLNSENTPTQFGVHVTADMFE